MEVLRRMKRRAQSAQGMVEFALVLPILLLVILGVFAFGHLFFVYSTVVGASREAARWGAAVGEAPSGAPRYQDCGSIRATAVRVGAFAGVTPNTVTIDYDHGPVDPPPAPVFANCPLGGNGPDPTQVNRGDRIVVRITVQYTPIVPLVNLPSFPLTAETARTIVKSVPVGDSPVAVDPCITLTHVIADPPPSPASSVPGQPVTFAVRVTSDDGTIPPGTVEYGDSAGNTRGPITLNTTTGRATFPAVTFLTADPDPTYWIHYTSSDSCHTSSGIDDQPYTVNPAATTLVFEPATTLPRPVNTPVVFTVRLSVNSPGAVTTSGPLTSEQVTITAPNAGSCNAPLTPSAGNTFTASCALTPTQVTNALTVTASYLGNPSYLSSTATTSMQVTPASPTLEFLGSYPPVEANTPVTFTVRMTLPGPGAGPVGETISFSGAGATTCNTTLTSTLTATCTLTPTVANNAWTVTASYNGNATYGPAYAQVNMQVNAPPPPPMCPTTSTMSFSNASALQFDVRNTSTGNVELTLSQVEVTWPSDEPQAYMNSVRFGAASGLGSCTTTGGQASRNCVWQAANAPGLAPPSQTVSSGGPSNWRGFGLALGQGATKTMRITFDHALNQGPYRVVLRFNDSRGNLRCTTTIDGNKATQ